MPNHPYKSTKKIFVLRFFAAVKFKFSLFCTFYIAKNAYFDTYLPNNHRMAQYMVECGVSNYADTLSVVPVLVLAKPAPGLRRWQPQQELQ